jgi:hypothetical protein
MKDAPQEAASDLELGQHSEPTERGYYGQALRAGQVPKLSPAAGRMLNTLLQGLNVLLWLLAMAFVSWRLYTVHIGGG